MAKRSAKSQANPLPLTGLRVVELGEPISAPLLGMLLADQGAEVVRFTSPSAPPADPVLDAMLARGKVELSLDPRADDGRPVLARLLAKADVVIDGTGISKTGPMGLDYRSIRAEANPGLVSCGLTAFPGGDPRESLPAYDTVTGAAGLIYEKPLGPPRFHEFAIGPVMSALFGASGVMAALVARQTTGRGQEVATAQSHANLFAQILQVLIKTGVPRGFLPFKMVGTPFVKRWKCGDGRWIFLHITLPAHCVRILEILEEHGYGKQAAELRSIISEETFEDPSQVKSIAEAKAIREAYDRIFLTKSAQEWEDLLGAELCCIKIRRVEEWVEDSMASGMSDVVEVVDPLFGHLKTPGPVVAGLEACEGVSPRQATGADDVLERWESEPGHFEPRGDGESRDLKAPLEGVRVLDLSRIIAGPCCSRILAELGADVISLQNPTNLDWALSFHLVFSTGKRSVTLDFKGDEGKAKLWKLMEEWGPDAFIQNYRNLDVAKAVGVEPETMLARFPGMAYTHLSAYGNHGEWQHRPGFEQVVQAVSGIQITYEKGGVPVLFPSPIIDIGCGLAGAFGTLANLYNSRRTGKGGVASTHLTNQSILFQLPSIAALQRDEGLARARRDGARVLFDREGQIVSDILRGRDGWALLAGPKRDVERWLEHAGLQNRWWLPGSGMLDVAAKAFLVKPMAHWRETLQAAGVADTVVLFDLPKIKNLVQDIAEVERGPLLSALKKDFPGVPEPLTFLRCPLRLSDTQIVDASPPPERGGDTSSVLRMIGEQVPPGTGVVPYPKNKPVWIWAASFIRWGYFAWRAGQI